MRLEMILSIAIHSLKHENEWLNNTNILQGKKREALGLCFKNKSHESFQHKRLRMRLVAQIQLCTQCYCFASKQLICQITALPNE